jgi:hypothetical protein
MSRSEWNWESSTCPARTHVEEVKNAWVCAQSGQEVRMSVLVLCYHYVRVLLLLLNSRSRLRLLLLLLLVPSRVFL